VLIDGFEVVGQDASITPAEGEKNNGSQGWLNESCILVDGVGYTGFHPPVPHDVVIRNNVVHDCSGSGIAEQGGDSITIAYNRIYDNSWWTVYGTSGLNIFHQLDTAGAHTVDGYKNFLVGNVVYGNHLNLPWIGANPPAITDGNGIIIDSNKHQDGGGPAYRGKTYIANNIVYGNGGRGVHVYESRNVDIVNNTTYNNMLSKSKYITCGEVDAVSDESVRAYNNIGVNLNGKQVDCTYDNVDVSYAYDMWSGKQIPVPGAHDILGNPELADPAKNEFTPRAGSPAIGSGTSVLAPALDFYAKPRLATSIDRGAIAVTH
jgi:parallel beta-helix repeat protein